MFVRHSSRRARVRAGVVAFTAAALVLGTVGPVQSQTVDTGAGTSGLSLTPLGLEISGLPTPLSANLGTILAGATNEESLLATLSLRDLGVNDVVAPPLTLSSADGPTRGSETREASIAGLGATLGLAEYAVESDDQQATALLGALGGEVTTPLGLGASLESQRLSTTAGPDATAGALALSVTGLEISLGDLLPADLLDQLPLDVVLDLLDQLGLPLSTDILGQLGDLDALVSTLQSSIGSAEDLLDVQNQLAAIADGNAAVDSALAALDSALAGQAQATQQLAAVESQIAQLTSQIGVLEAIPLPLPGQLAELAQLQGQLSTLQGQLPALQSAVGAATAAVDQAQAALDGVLAGLGLDDLLDQLTALEDLLGGLLGTLDGLLDDVDLDSLLDDLLGLLDVPLVEIGSVELVLDTLADATASAGTVTCEAGGIRLLGQDVPTPSCDDLTGVLSTVTDLLDGVLDVLPVAGVLPEISLTGPTQTASGAGVPNAEGITEAIAGVTALSLDIESVELTAITDGLVPELSGLIGDLDGLLGALDAAPGIDVLDPLLGATAARASGTDGVQAAALPLPAGLDAALDSVLAGLPTGAGLDGLRTLGLDADLGAAEMTSVFSSTATPATPATPGTPGSPTTPAAPGTPGQPGSPNLPTTGADAHKLALAALAAIAAGAMAISLSQPAAVELATERRRRRGV